MSTLDSLKERFKLADRFLRRPVSDQIVEEISKALHLEWKRLPRCLDLNQSVAEDIEHASGGLTESEKRRRVLVIWKVSKGDGATYECLIIALLKSECMEDAKSLCKLLMHNLNSGKQCS